MSLQPLYTAWQHAAEAATAELFAGVPAPAAAAGGIAAGSAELAYKGAKRAGDTLADWTSKQIARHIMRAKRAKVSVSGQKRASVDHMQTQSSVKRAYVATRYRHTSYGPWLYPTRRTNFKRSRKRSRYYY